MKFKRPIRASVGVSEKEGVADMQGWVRGGWGGMLSVRETPNKRKRPFWNGAS